MELEIVAGGLRFPEGPVPMPDGSVILVEIEAGRVARVRPDGAKEIVATPGNGPNGLALGPDGALCCVNNGNICVATLGEGGITVVSPQGEEVEFVPTPDFFTTSIAFGGPGMRDAWITLSQSGRLARTRWPREGLRPSY